MRSLYNKSSSDITISATAFQFNAPAHWHICPLLEPVSAFCHSKIRALAFATIHEQPFPLAHYCGIGDPPSVASATLILGWMIQKFQMKQLQKTRFSEMRCVGLHCRSNQTGLCQSLPKIFGSPVICPRM
jgi:hypothetical protein